MRWPYGEGLVHTSRVWCWILFLDVIWEVDGGGARARKPADCYYFVIFCVLISLSALVI